MPNEVIHSFANSFDMSGEESHLDTSLESVAKESDTPTKSSKDCTRVRVSQSCAPNLRAPSKAKSKKKRNKKKGKSKTSSPSQKNIWPTPPSSPQIPHLSPVISRSDSMENIANDDIRDMPVIELMEDNKEVTKPQTSGHLSKRKPEIIGSQSSNTSTDISETTAIPLTSTSNTSIADTYAAIPSTSKADTNSTVNQNASNISKEAIPKEMMTTPYDYKAFSLLYSTRFQELMSMNEPMIPKTELEEKLVTLDLWHNRLIESLRRQLIEIKLEMRDELRDAKTKQWCAICHCLATKYCCVRFYCSTECQKIDWKNGHKLQCLTLKQ